MHVRGIRTPALAVAAAASLTAGALVMQTSASGDTGWAARMIARASAYTDHAGNVWQPDASFANGGQLWGTHHGIAGTDEDALYQNERWGMTGYHIAVPSAGTYHVRVLESENYFRKAGQRVFTITAEGQTVASNVDIAGSVGRFRAMDVVFDALVTDGALDLGFVSAVDDPKVDAIEVTKANGAATALQASPPPLRSPSPGPLSFLKPTASPRPTSSPSSTAPPAPAPTQTQTTAPTTAPTTASAPPASGSTTTLSGLPWRSGAWVQGSTEPSEFNGFMSWRGRPGDVAILFTARSVWSDMTNLDWPVDGYAGWPGKLSLAMPMYPQEGNMAACASGSYDSYWRQIGTTLVGKKRGDSFIRLGWEFNGDWFWWNSSNVDQYKSCFRHTALALKSTDPQAIIDWNMVAHASANPSFAAYPGDDVVDVVGVDSYDFWPASPDQASWDAQANGTNGINTVISFARQHGKKFSVPEWGVVDVSPGGGDNPFYIQKMYDTFKANADVLAYEGYFNSSESGNVESSLWNPTQNPNAAAKYKSLFGR